MPLSSAQSPWVSGTNERVATPWSIAYGLLTAHRYAPPTKNGGGMICFSVLVGKGTRRTSPTLPTGRSGSSGSRGSSTTTARGQLETSRTECCGRRRRRDLRRLASRRYGDLPCKLARVGIVDRRDHDRQVGVHRHRRREQ